MRNFLTLSLILTFVACSHQEAPDFPRAQAGIEKSVFPVYFTTGSYYSDNELERVLEPEYRACAAVYVAKNVMVTSSTVFLSRKQNTADLVHPYRITLVDGNHRIGVVDITFNEPLGIAIIETSETGTPLALRKEPLSADLPLSAIGYSFKRNPGWKARSVWKREAVSIDKDWLRDAGYETTFVADLKLNPGLCGAPVLDEQNRLAGIIHQKYGDSTASIISAPAIATALKEFYGE